MDSFTVTALELPGVLLIKPRVFPDERGFATVPFAVKAFAEQGITSSFAQEYMSESKKGTIRGLHFQKAPHPQDKLIRCSSGEIWDVIADIDPASPTFGKYVAVTLSAQDQSMVFIPGKYAHGFCVLSERAVTEYKLSDVFAPEVAGGVRWNDPKFNIAWPVTEPILSQKDTEWPLL